MIFFDSEDDYRTGCRKVSHCQQQQSYSGLRSSGRSNSTYFCYDFYCSIDSAQKSECYNFPTTSYLVCFSSAQWPLCSWTTGNLSFFIELDPMLDTLVFMGSQHCGLLSSFHKTACQPCCILTFFETFYCFHHLLLFFLPFL